MVQDVGSDTHLPRSTGERGARSGQEITEDTRHDYGHTFGLRSSESTAKGAASRTCSPAEEGHHFSSSCRRSPAPALRASRSRRSHAQRHRQVAARSTRRRSQAVLEVIPEGPEPVIPENQQNAHTNGEARHWAASAPTVQIGHRGARAARAKPAPSRLQNGAKEARRMVAEGLSCGDARRAPTTSETSGKLVFRH